MDTRQLAASCAVAGLRAKAGPQVPLGSGHRKPQPAERARAFGELVRGRPA